MANVAKKKPPVPKKKLAKSKITKELKKTKTPAKPKLVAKKPIAKPAEKKAPTKTVGVGHNGGPVMLDHVVLKSVVTRVENLKDTIDDLNEDVKEVYTEAKAKGLNPKRIREIVALRRKDKQKLREEKEEREMYMLALDPELAEVLS